MCLFSKLNSKFRPKTVKFQRKIFKFRAKIDKLLPKIVKLTKPKKICGKYRQISTKFQATNAFIMKISQISSQASQTPEISNKLFNLFCFQIQTPGGASFQEGTMCTIATYVPDHPEQGGGAIGYSARKESPNGDWVNATGKNKFQMYQYSNGFCNILLLLLRYFNPKRSSRPF